MVLVVEIAQIARVVPAVLKGCCGRFGVFPIALRDVGTSYLYLLIVGYAHLTPGSGLPTVSRLWSQKGVAVIMGAHSVAPYPWSMRNPICSQQRASAGARYAPPLTKKRKWPPKR